MMLVRLKPTGLPVANCKTAIVAVFTKSKKENSKNTRLVVLYR